MNGTFERFFESGDLLEVDFQTRGVEEMAVVVYSLRLDFPVLPTSLAGVRWTHVLLRYLQSQRCPHILSIDVTLREVALQQWSHLFVQLVKFTVSVL